MHLTLNFRLKTRTTQSHIHTPYQDKCSASPIATTTPAETSVRKWVWQVLTWMTTTLAESPKDAATRTTTTTTASTSQHSTPQSMSQSNPHLPGEGHTPRTYPATSTARHGAPIGFQPSVGTPEMQRVAQDLPVFAQQRQSVLPRSQQIPAQRNPTFTAASNVPKHACPYSPEMYRMTGELVAELGHFTGPELLPLAVAVLRMAAACELQSGVYDKNFKASSKLSNPTN